MTNEYYTEHGQTDADYSLTEDNVELNFNKEGTYIHYQSITTQN